MPKLLITIGISASGKSTYAKELVKQGWVEVNRDTARFTLFCNGVEDWGLYKFSKDKERQVTEYCDKQLKEAMILKKDIIVSNTHLDKKYITQYETIASENGYDLEVKFFHITLEEAWKRDERRSNSVGRGVITKQWQQWLKVIDKKKYVPDWTKPKAIICDIDGTVAKMNGRKPFEFDKVDTDLPRGSILSLIESFVAYKNLKVVFVSGREDSCKEKTLQWLQLHFYVPFSPQNLYMRKTGDYRCDKIVKEEIFWEHIADKFNVVAVFDDRKKVIRMWYDIGIPTVIDVSDTYEEF